MPVVAQDDGADLVLLQVQRQAVSLVRKLQQLAGHRILQAVDLRDSVTGRDDAPDVCRDQAGVEILKPLPDDFGDLFGADSHFFANSYEAARRRRNCCNRVATLASTRRSPYWSLRPPRIRGSTTTCRLISLPRRFDSSSATRSRSFGVSSTAVVTVARTRPAASSTSRWNSSSIAPTSRTRSDSMSSFARLVASSSNTCGEAETSAIRRSVAIVGLVSTAATSGSDSSSRTLAKRRPHSGTWPSCSASSKTAFAYRLAAAVATRNLTYSPVDQLPVLVIVERLADNLLRRRHDQVRHLAPHRLDRALPLGLDLFACGLDSSLRLVFSLLLELLAQLLTRLRCGVDHALGGLARVGQLRLGFVQPSLGRGARLLCLLQLFGDRPLAGLSHLDDLGVHVAGKDGQHDQERDQLDDHGPVDLDDARDAGQKHDYLAAGTFERNTKPKARLMKYIASTSPTTVSYTHL